MKDKILALCLILQIGLQLSLCQKKLTFEQYVLEFNKKYNSPQEYEVRKEIYYNNLQRMRYIESELQFETGTNKFTDRTKSQMSLMRNQKIRPPLRSVTPHYSIQRKLGGPSSLDWRSRGAVTSIKDQGYCGACWAFATAAYCESSLIINNGFNSEIDLSEQYLLQCTSESDCKGGFPAYALLSVVTGGIPKQETFSYKPEVQHPDICNSRKNLKIKGKQVNVYFSLTDIQMIYLLQTSPIIVGVGSQDWQFYKGGIMKCQPNVTEDHAVLLVGYTPEYWIVKNQWGLDWGENGYVRISRNRQHNCLMGVQVDTMAQVHFKIIFLVVALIVILLNG